MRRGDAKFQARRIVSAKLRRFFAIIKERFGKSTEEFWRDVENKRSWRTEARPDDRGSELK
jgi:hypothetical protein